MPLYDYTCPDGHTVEQLRKYEQRDALLTCPACGLMCERRPPLPHMPPDGIYSYAPNIGDPSAHERRYEKAKRNTENIQRRLDGERPTPLES